MNIEITILNQVKEEIESIYKDSAFDKRFFHSIHHVKEVVSTALELGEGYQLDEDNMELLQIAAWFHDSGYVNGNQEKHEERSAEIAKSFLDKINYPANKTNSVIELILATEMSAVPKTLLEEIIRDADMSHMGRKTYFSRCGQLRTEWEKADGKILGDTEWFKMNLEFMKSHSFHTPVAREFFDRRMLRNISKLEEMYVERLNHDKHEKELEERLESGKENPYEKPPKPGRGIETMYRVALRNHNQLSKIADNKANILLSINALMISIVISSLASKLDTNAALLIPTVILVFVCMISIVIATLATRPKITSANFSKEKFLQNKINILFFGNFYKMPLEDFEWGMQKLMADDGMLYSSLSKDLYFLGLVLAKKYKLLRTGYNFFMIGMVVSAIAFILAFSFNS